MKLTRRNSVLTYLAVYSLLPSFFAFGAAGAQTRAEKKEQTGVRLEALAANAKDLTKAALGSEPGADENIAAMGRVLHVLARRDGVILGDGVLLSDVVLLGDGALLADGVILNDTRAMLAMISGDPTASMPVVKDYGVLNLNY